MKTDSYEAVLLLQDNTTCVVSFELKHSDNVFMYLLSNFKGYKILDLNKKGSSKIYKEFN